MNLVHFHFFFYYINTWHWNCCSNIYACITTWLWNLVEFGAYVKDGDGIQKLLVDSPDEFIKIDHNLNSRSCCEPDILRTNSDNIALELKSPYPQ